MSAQPSDLLISRIRALCHEAINVGEPTALCVASLELCEAFEKLLEAGTRFGAVVRAEARDWTEDYQHENGNYENVCIICGKNFYGYKRRVVCRVCAKHNGRAPL